MDKTKNDAKLVKAAEALSKALVMFSLSIRDADAAFKTKKEVTRVYVKTPKAQPDTGKGESPKKRGRPAKEDAAPKARSPKAKAAKSGAGAQAKPCPVTGILNTHRRFSYLMPEVRTEENLKKFKGWASKSSAAASA